MRPLAARARELYELRAIGSFLIVSFKFENTRISVSKRKNIPLAPPGPHPHLMDHGDLYHPLEDVYPVRLKTGQSI
jgi:hypothetical protein